MSHLYFNRVKDVLRHFILVLCAMLTFHLSMAQTSERSVITLKSGLVLKGKVVSIDINDKIVLEMPNGEHIDIEMDKVKEIDLIAEESPRETIQRAKPTKYAFKNRGFYSRSSLGFPAGFDDFGDPTVNISLMLGGGYTFNKNLSIGLTGGVDFYWWPDAIVNPLALEVRGRLGDGNFAPFYSVQGGYGFLSDMQTIVESSSGGPFFSAGVGLIAKYREHSAWEIMLAYRYQEIQGVHDFFIFEPDIFFVGQSVAASRFVYNRLELRFGFFFE